MAPPSSLPAAKPPREWAPRMWQGCDVWAWWRLLFRNRFAFGFAYVYIGCVITTVSVLHSLLRWVAESWYGDRPDRTPLTDDPVFIVGHWRTGTTLLHELLMLDDRHNCPNYYQCMAPHHFLLTESLFTRAFSWLMPEHRPMDNMAAGWDKPQEDEFALCMLGQPSPYLTIAFPNHPPQDQEAFDLERFAPRALARWKRAFLGFLRRLTFKRPGRLVLKSPTHSCRLPLLLEMFPNARFVHMVRDPYVVFPSTVNLWRSLYEKHGLQKPTFAGLEEYVFTTFLHLYGRLETGMKRIRPNRFFELRYEDLVRDPIAQLRQLYSQLELGDFERVLPAVQKYLAEHAGYQTNRYKPLDPRLQEQITQRWGEIIRRYGYERPTITRGPAVAEPKLASAV